MRLEAGDVIEVTFSMAGGNFDGSQVVMLRVREVGGDHPSGSGILGAIFSPDIEDGETTRSITGTAVASYETDVGPDPIGQFTNWRIEVPSLDPSNPYAMLGLTAMPDNSDFGGSAYTATVSVTLHRGGPTPQPGEPSEPPKPEGLDHEAKEALEAAAFEINKLAAGLDVINSATNPAEIPLKLVGWAASELAGKLAPDVGVANAIAQTILAVTETAETIVGAFNPVTFVLSLSSTLDKLAALALTRLAQDPPDGNYGEVFRVPDWDAIPDVGAEGSALIAASYAMMQNYVEMVVAAERFQGAWLAGDEDAMTAQQAAFDAAIDAAANLRADMDAALDAFLDAESLSLDTVNYNDDAAASLAATQDYLDGLANPLDADPFLANLTDNLASLVGQSRAEDEVQELVDAIADGVAAFSGPRTDYLVLTSLDDEGVLTSYVVDQNFHGDGQILIGWDHASFADGADANTDDDVYELPTLVAAGHVLGGTDDDDITGNGDDNHLEGGEGDDLLDGAGGNDLLDGNGGSDTADYRDRTEAVVVALDGADPAIVTIGGSDEDTLQNVENVIGGSTADTLTGDEFNNSFRGGGGNDLLDGGDGADTADYSDKALAIVVTLNDGAPVTVTVGGVAEDTIENIENVIGGSAADTLIGDGLANSLTGGVGNDTLAGLAGDDSLYGSEGSDSLDGGTGNDAMAGGAGDDTYLVDSEEDFVDETGGGGFDTVKSTVTFNLDEVFGNQVLGRVERLVLTGTAEIDGFGSFEADNILGNDANNELFGGNGIDTLEGNGGNDLVRGGGGNDGLYGGAGNDEVQGDDGDDTLQGGEGDDVLFGYGGDFVTDGDDRLDGGGGADLMQGGVGDDIYVIDNSGDVADEAFSVPGQGTSDGHDTVEAWIDFSLADADHAKGDIEDLWLWGSAVSGTGNTLDNAITGNDGDNVLGGLDGADDLFGTLGDDQLNGGDGEDVLDGGDGDDWLDGGTDADEMSGGFGNDVYIVSDGDDIVIEPIDDGGGGAAAAAVALALADDEPGIDTVRSSVDFDLSDEDHVIGDVENLVLLGTAATGIGNELDNEITGNAEDNSLTGAGGVDAIDGGAGIDTAVYSVALIAASFSFVGGHWVVDDGDGADTLVNIEKVASAGLNFRLVGGGGYASVAEAEADNAAGDVILTAGGGDPPGNTPPSAISDTDGATDGVAENAATGTQVGITAHAIDAEGAVTYSLADSAGGRFAIDALAGVVTVANSALLDFETATSHGIVVRATDTAGASGEAGFTIVLTDLAGQTLAGSNGDDVLTGTAEPDTITGGKGKDTIDGGGGSDTVSYAKSKAKVKIDLDKAAQKGGDAKGDILVNVESIIGSKFGDTLFGNAADNLLDGGKGDDKLSGRGGIDTLIGGKGDDTFIFSTGFGSDTVADYGKGDEFDLRGTDVANFAALKAVMVETGGGVTIDFGDGDVLAIAGATIKLLSQHKGDFDFG